MELRDDRIGAAQREFLKELTDAGVLIPSGVPGLYGRGGVFEGVLRQFDQLVDRAGARPSVEVMHFPPIINRRHYLATDHLETFPNLMGSVHSFVGRDREHAALLQKKEQGEDWTRDLGPTEVMMTPAACYPLYPTATGTLPEGGRTVNLCSFVFRHEPSPDPARMQIFRQHEYVRLGTPEQALEHRNTWLSRGLELLHSVGVEARSVPANDPFFGRAARLMAATQKEQELKYELVATVSSAEAPTAIASCNLHLDHFGRAFAIQTADGATAHTACIGFGLERITLALFRAHGFAPERWPSRVKQVLAL